MRPPIQVTVVPVHSEDVRGIRSSLFAAATDEEKLSFSRYLGMGMTEERALEMLADQLALNRSSGEAVGKLENIDVRARR